MDEEKLKQLRKLEIFSNLSDKELEAIAPKASLKKFEKNMVILDEADTNAYMYGVISGEVKAFRISEDGRESILALRGEGKSFGELSMIDGKTAPAAVSATEKSLVAVISRENFNEILDSQPKLTKQLLKALCSQLRDSLRMLELFNQKNASERVRMLLEALAEERGTNTPEGVAINLKLTHQRIADMTGLTRESVTRALDKWKKDGKISTGKDKRLVLSKDFSRYQ